jgi:hypothetical protein
MTIDHNVSAKMSSNITQCRLNKTPINTLKERENQHLNVDHRVYYPYPDPESIFEIIRVPL